MFYHEFTGLSRFGYMFLLAGFWTATPAALMNIAFALVNNKELIHVYQSS